MSKDKTPKEAENNGLYTLLALVRINKYKMELTDKEKQSIRTLNYITTFDGVIESEDEIKYLLNEGVKKFIAPKRQYLVTITETAYPIRIKY